MSGSELSRHSEAAFETVIEAHLLQHGYVSVDRGRGKGAFYFVSSLRPEHNCGGRPRH